MMGYGVIALSLAEMHAYASSVNRLATVVRT